MTSKVKDALARLTTSTSFADAPAPLKKPRGKFHVDTELLAKVKETRAELSEQNQHQPQLAKG